MGIYLNPDNEGFWESVRSEIYVDKTGLIAYTNRCLNTEQKYICVSRPRRFGKSMALKMLSAYYSRGCDSEKLFAGLNIANDASFHTHLNQYNIIYLNMQHFLIESKKQDITTYLEQEITNELLETYKTLPKRQDMSLSTTLKHIYAITKEKFIFLIDEWDCVMRERQESEELQKQYLDFLRNLLKDQSHIALAYMTGILPVKKYGQHKVNSAEGRREDPLGGSALNMFWEYSMTNQKALEEYTGFTEGEVKELCKRFHMNFSEVSSWYDGYRFTTYKHIYNPKSVVEAIFCHYCSNYWTPTETYDALKVYMDMDFNGLRSDIVQMLGMNE